MIIAWKQLPAQVSLVLPVAPIVFFICIGLLIGLIPIGPFYENFMTCTHMRVIWCHMYLFCVGDLRRGFLLCFAGKQRYSCRNINMIKKNYVAVIPRTILFLLLVRDSLFFLRFSQMLCWYMYKLCASPATWWGIPSDAVLQLLKYPENLCDLYKEGIKYIYHIPVSCHTWRVQVSHLTGKYSFIPVA